METLKTKTMGSLRLCFAGGGHSLMIGPSNDIKALLESRMTDLIEFVSDSNSVAFDITLYFDETTLMSVTIVRMVLLGDLLSKLGIFNPAWLAGDDASLHIGD